MAEDRPALERGEELPATEARAGARGEDETGGADGGRAQDVAPAVTGAVEAALAAAAAAALSRSGDPLAA